jgi:transcription antitermination factor NusG
MISSELRPPSREARSAECPAWYACYTRGRHEKKVASHLHSRRIETFLPVRRLDVQWSDRRKSVDLPLFPSYVFARFPMIELPQVLSTRGLVAILRTGGRPAAIPDGEIDNVRRFADVVAAHRIVPERETLAEAGDRVRVVAGPFRGIEGVAVLRRGRRRLLVALGALPEGLAVDLDGAALQVIGAGGPQA